MGYVHLVFPTNAGNGLREMCESLKWRTVDSSCVFQTVSCKSCYLWNRKGIVTCAFSTDTVLWKSASLLCWWWSPPQNFIAGLVAKLDGVHKQKDLQSEGIEHPVICHSHYRHEPYHFNNPHHQHHFHQSRGQNQTLWQPPASHLASHQDACIQHIVLKTSTKE